MRKTNKNLNVIAVIHDDGGYEEICTYDGKFSAYYALTLFICRKYGRNFYNRRDLEWARKKIIVGMSKKTCFFYEGKDVYSCCAPELRLYDEGISSSEFEFEPAMPAV